MSKPYQFPPHGMSITPVQMRDALVAYKRSKGKLPEGKQGVMAKQIGCSQPGLSYFLQGKSNLSPQKKEAVFNFLVSKGVFTHKGQLAPEWLDKVMKREREPERNPEIAAIVETGMKQSIGKARLMPTEMNMIEKAYVIAGIMNNSSIREEDKAHMLMCLSHQLRI